MGFIYRNMKTMTTLGILATLLCGYAMAQLDPQAGLEALTPAEGLAVSLFAAEPMLINPTCMDIDATGRVWVCEAVNYRLFNQPITRDNGDRIRVLEDTDGDGVCDKATTFYQDPGLRAPMAIAVLGDRVYVGMSPDLFYLRDTDGDGVADEKTTVLTGFSSEDHDHTLHGIMYGPDNKLYYTVGDRGLEVTDKSGHTVKAGEDTKPYSRATVLRSDLDGEHLELLAWNLRNPYEPTVDSFGTIWSSDNDDDGNEQVRMVQVVEGGDYGYGGPRVMGDRKQDEVHWRAHMPGVIPTTLRTGFGSPTGLLFYEGDMLPEPYQNAMIHADAGPRVIRSYPMTANGAGYDGEQHILLSSEEDTWFRPSDVCVAPDGSIFVADWYDPGVGGHRMGDFEQGRIYRLAPIDEHSPADAFNLDTPRGVAEAVASPNQARRYLGFQKLTELAHAHDYAAFGILAEENDPVLRARSLWVMALAMPDPSPLLQSLMQDSDGRIRTLAVRIAANRGMDPLHIDSTLVDDSDAAVRRQILVSPFERSIEELVQFALHYDGEDRIYREALGIAWQGREAVVAEALAAEWDGTWEAVAAGLILQLHRPDALAPAAEAVLDESLDLELREMGLRVLDAINTPEAGDKIVSLLLSGDLPQDLADYALWVLAYDEGQRWAKVMNNENMDAYIEAMVRDDATYEKAVEFIRQAKRPTFAGIFMERAQDETRTVQERRNALREVQSLAAMLRMSEADTYATALKTMVLTQKGGIAIEAARTLGGMRGMAAAEALHSILTDETRSPMVAKACVQILAADKSGATYLMNHVEEGTLPPDVQLEVQELVHASPFDDIRMMAEQLLPRDLTADGQALPPIAELLAMEGDPVKGKLVFSNEEMVQCSRCHIVGDEGRAVGPNLNTIGQKYGRDGLLETILNPSAAISHEYQVFIVKSNEYGFISGFITSEDENGFTLMDSEGKTYTLTNDDVEAKKLSKVSLMPTGLASSMSAQDLMDLVAYLETLKRE